MKLVSSISGGKTSAMMAVEFPADHYVFAVVLTDQAEATPKDKGLLTECQNRIPWFKASRELDQTLLNVLKLEQLIGQKIDWVAAPFTFDELVLQRTIYPRYRSGNPMLPNANHRFCTEQLKLIPIFWHCFLNYYDSTPLLMNIGFRWDEPRRVEGWNCDNDKFRYPIACSLQGRKQWQYNDIEWRISQFPLYENQITKSDVKAYWDAKGWEFPKVSNCDFCFHHKAIQQQIQNASYPERAKWWIDLEAQTGSTFGKTSLQNVLSQLLMPRIFDTDDEPMCHCTD